MMALYLFQIGLHFFAILLWIRLIISFTNKDKLTILVLFGIFMSLFFIIAQLYFLSQWYVNKLSDFGEWAWIFFDYFNAMFNIAVFIFIEKYVESLRPNDNSDGRKNCLNGF